MKKILILGIVVLTVFIIYLTTIDKKVYYVSLGDEISLGITENGYYEKSFSVYIKEYLAAKNKLEIYIDDYVTQGYRITDVINDIKNNKEIEETNRTIKNSLIKADLVTITIGTNDIISKINDEKNLTKIDYKRLYKNINTITDDLDKLLNIIREYCKEDIIILGPNIKTENETLNEILSYASDKFDEISQKHNVAYIKTNEIIKGKLYPTKDEYKELADQTINIINNNLLK